MKTLDASLAYTPSWAFHNSTLQMSVFNVLGASKVTAYYEVSENNRGTPTVEPNFLNDENYQAPGSLRLTARYTF